MFVHEQSKPYKLSIEFLVYPQPMKMSGSRSRKISEIPYRCTGKDEKPFLKRLIGVAFSAAGMCIALQAEYYRTLKLLREKRAFSVSDSILEEITRILTSICFKK